MYTEQDYTEIRGQIRRRSLALGIPAVVLLAGVIVSFVFRIKWLTMGLSVLLGAFCIFGYGMLLYLKCAARGVHYHYYEGEQAQHGEENTYDVYYRADDWVTVSAFEFHYSSAPFLSLCPS